MNEHKSYKDNLPLHKMLKWISDGWDSYIDILQ
jgi:hypothetical protein